MAQQVSVHWMSCKDFGAHKVSPSSFQDYQLRHLKESMRRVLLGMKFGLRFGVPSAEKCRHNVCALFTGQLVLSGGPALPLPDTLHEERLYRIVVHTNSWINRGRG